MTWDGGALAFCLWISPEASVFTFSLSKSSAMGHQLNGPGTGTGSHYTSYCRLSDLDMHQLNGMGKSRV